MRAFGAADDQAGLTPLTEDARKALHRMAGLGGTVGFPRVSVKAAALEGAARDTPMSRVELLEVVAGLRRAFALDMADPDAGLPSLPPAVAAMTVLLVEDERVQRTILWGEFRVLGHSPVTVTTGEEALEAARRLGRTSSCWTSDCRESMATRCAAC